jgi:hypothetical protein
MRESSDQQYTSSQTLERLLNEAIIHADISNSFEEYIEIFDTFYADESLRLRCQSLGVAPVARRNVFVKWL